MFKLLLCVVAVAAYTDCPACHLASGGPTQYCAYEASTSCGCTSCALASVNSFRVSDCSLTTCARRLVAETTDLEEAAPATAQWGRRRRRFFDYRRRRRRTPYPPPFPTPSPTGILGH